VKVKVKVKIKVAAIVPSAGTGTRMCSGIEKPFIKLFGRELILYSLIALEKSELITEIIISASKNSISKIERLVRREGLRKVKGVVCGGAHRAGSVKKGLLHTSADIDLVLVHDCARPFLTAGMIRGSLDAAKRYGVSLCAVRVKPTIKEVDAKGFVKKTLNRQLLWEAQTPQSFKKAMLENSYKILNRSYSRFTDDVALLEAVGKRVKIVEGDYRNIKITTPEDIAVAEAIIKGKGKGKGRGKRQK